jgi:Spy/CpxP family protein refolding chaperone
MKTHITIAAIALLAAGSVLAEPPAPPHGRGGPDIDRIAILLDLDEGQKAAVKQVFDEQRQQRQAEWEKAKDGQKENQTRPTREAMQARREQMRKETVEKMRPILTDTQMTKFEALMASRPDMPPRDGKNPSQE